MKSKAAHSWECRDAGLTFAGYKDLPPAGYRPSVEMVRIKGDKAWDRRVVSVTVTRPGSWVGDEWWGDRTDEGWDAVELSKLAPVVANLGKR